MITKSWVRIHKRFNDDILLIFHVFMLINDVIKPSLFCAIYSSSFRIGGLKMNITLIHSIPHMMLQNISIVA